MSSIERDVKKKAPPRPEDRGFFSRSSPLCFVTLKVFGWLSHSRKLSLRMVAKFECERRGKQDDVNVRRWGKKVTPVETFGYGFRTRNGIHPILLCKIVIRTAPTRVPSRLALHPHSALDP